MILNTSFQTTLAAVFQILIMGTCGYALVKTKILKDAELPTITRLLMYFFLPVFMFVKITGHFRFESHPYWYIYPLMGVCVCLLGILIGWLTIFCINRNAPRDDFLALVAFQNSGYLPMILIATLLPQERADIFFVSISLFLIGFNVMIWSLGVWLLRKDKNDPFKLKNLLNPPLIALLASLLIVAFNWQQHIPTVLSSPLALFSQCTLPIAMILIGGGLAGIKLDQVSKRNVCSVLLAKLIFKPLIALSIIFVFKINNIFGFLFFLECIVPCAVTLSVIARYHKRTATFINQGIFYSHIVSLVSMPLFLILYQRLVQTF